jgi:hypothetical protein
MSRPLIALAAGLAFLAAYLFAVLALADHVMAWHWLFQAAFFLAAGTLWVPPIHWLMLWGARKRLSQR